MLQLNMQRSVLLWLVCQFSLLANAAGPRQTTITCKWYNSTSGAAVLYKVENGEAVKLNARQPGELDTCQFSFPMEKEGIYYIQKIAKGATYNYVIYLKPGDNKSVDLYTSKQGLDFESCNVQSPNRETKSLQAWTDAFNKYCMGKAAYSKHEETYRQYDGFVKFASSFLKSNKTTNAYFNAWLADKVDTDLKYLRAANFFYFNRRLYSKYDSSEAVKAFYQPLENKNIVNDARLLRSEHGLELLNYVFGYWKFNQVKNVQDLQAAHYSENIPLITNKEIKTLYILQKMKEITKYEDFVKYVQPYKNLFTKAALKATYQKKYEELYLFAKGTPGYDFELKDVHNKTYTLSDFKGKVVVIDIWAMWCAPCLQEKPVMEKIAEGYHDRNDIVFVGVSVDNLHRREVWADFVKRKGFTSIELLSNFSESIYKYYKIEGIPRFMIFDKEGKIVTVDAPRPSNPKFKKLIDETLASAK
jgi:thiol-disulfide isomerase/thioredoxin